MIEMKSKQSKRKEDSEKSKTKSSGTLPKKSLKKFEFLLIKTMTFGVSAKLQT